MSETRRPRGLPDDSRPPSKPDASRSRGASAPVTPVEKSAKALIEDLLAREKRGQLTAVKLADDVNLLLDVRARLRGPEYAPPPSDPEIAKQIDEIEVILVEIAERFGPLAFDPQTQTSQRVRDEEVFEQSADDLLALSETQRSRTSIMNALGYHDVNEDLTAVPGFKERLSHNAKELEAAMALHPQNGRELSTPEQDQGTPTSEPHLRLVRRNTPGRSL